MLRMLFTTKTITPILNWKKIALDTNYEVKMSNVLFESQPSLERMYYLVVDSILQHDAILQKLLATLVFFVFTLYCRHPTM